MLSDGLAGQHVGGAVAVTDDSWQAQLGDAVARAGLPMQRWGCKGLGNEAAGAAAGLNGLIGQLPGAAPGDM
jgi:hypothetical protein